MSRIRFELNKEGVSELLKSEKMAAICNAEAQTMTTATGTEWKGYTAATRVVVTNKESKHQHANES